MMPHTMVFNLLDSNSTHFRMEWATSDALQSCNYGAAYQRTHASGGGPVMIANGGTVSSHASRPLMLASCLCQLPRSNVVQHSRQPYWRKPMPENSGPPQMITASSYLSWLVVGDKCKKQTAVVRERLAWTMATDSSSGPQSALCYETSPASRLQGTQPISKA